MIGSSSEHSNVTFCVRADGVDSAHCRLVFDESNGSCEMTSLTSVSTTWLKRPLGDWEEVFCGDSRTMFPNDAFRLGTGLVFEMRRFNSGFASSQGIRPSMEDAEVLIDSLLPGLSWYGCYDGHGGSECSKFVQKHLHVNFVNEMSENVSASSICEALMSAFALTESQFRDFAVGMSSNVGSVVNVCVLWSGSIFCANLGDARAVLASGTELSVDHKPGSESDRITASGGSVVNGRVNGRLAVSRAIGDFEFKNSVPEKSLVSPIPEIRIHRIMPTDDFLIIACDGLFDVMSSAEAIEFVHKRVEAFTKRNEEPDARQIAIDLVTESVMKRNTHDNVTVLIVFLKQFCH